MSSRSFDDYAATESGLPLEEAPGNYSHGGRKPFSPIEELEEPLSENMGLIGGFSAASAAGTSAGSSGQLQGDERGRQYHQQGGASYHDNTRRTTTSPRSSTSPKQPSLSPQSHSSGSSGHSSPRSPPTGYSHPPPPTSQPPPLPPSATPSRALMTGTAKSRGGHIPKSGSDHYGQRTGSGAYEMRHVPHPDQHHKSHNRRVAGVGKSQHGTDSHVPFQQLKDNSRIQSHSVKVSGRQPFHVSSSDSNSGYSGGSVVNTRVIPSKKYATPISDHSPSTSDHYPPAESFNDPGDRGSPSGASSPSSTPNSTLSKLHHMQMQQEALQASHSDSRLLRTDSQSSGDSGNCSLEASKSDTVLHHDSGSSSAAPLNGTTKVHMGNVSLSVQNALNMNMKHSGKEREKQSSLASVSNKYHPTDASNGVGDAHPPPPPRVLHQPRSSSSVAAASGVASKVAMFNLNLNNSGNSPSNSQDHTNSPSGQQPSSLHHGNQTAESNAASNHHTSPSKSSSKGVKTPSPKTTVRSQHGGEAGGSRRGTAGDESEEHQGRGGRKEGGMDSRSSSIEELSQINVEEMGENENEGDDETDGGRHRLVIKPEATKSTQHSIGGYPGKPPPPHGQGGGPPPPGYPSSSTSVPQPPPPPAPTAVPGPPLQQHPQHHTSHHHTSEPHHSHQPPPPNYPPYMFTTSLSQGASGGLSQSLSQGTAGGGGGPSQQLSQGMPSQQLSQGLPPSYQAYEQHYPPPPGRGDLGGAMYPPPPAPPPIQGGGGKYVSRGGGGGVPRQHPHHISPPHGSQQYEQQPQAPPYATPPSTQQPPPKHQSMGYPMSHDSRSGVHMQPQLPPHMMSHDIPLHHRNVPSYLVSSAVVGMAHEAAGKGDINTLHHMISKGEIDAYGFTEHYFTLAHKAAMHGRLSVLKFLIKEGNLPLLALQEPDESLTTPAMLAIQGGHLDCLQWLVEEGKVPIEVRNTGGETLVHHAAYHGQIKCLEWLLSKIPKEEKKEILDELGVTPAHFAAQGGHLDCILLLLDRAYSINHADKDNQRPLDWADAMGQYICVRFLIMYEACWSFSREISQMQKKNAHLQETLAKMEQEHQLAITKLQQTHDERIAKMREHYVDFTHSILTLKDSTPGSGSTSASGSNTSSATSSNSSSGGGAGTSGSSGSSSSGSGSSKSKSQQLARKALQQEPPSTSSSGSSQQQRRPRPPLPPDAKKRTGGRGGGHDGKKERGTTSHDGAGDQDQHDSNIDYRTATPQEVLEKRVTSVTQRMTASREARKHRGGHVQRTFSPLTPIIQRLYSAKADEDSKGSERIKSQRQTEERRSAPKVKFSTTVTEYPHDYGRYDHSMEDSTGRMGGKSSGHSPAHSSTHSTSSSSSSGHGGDHGNSRTGGKGSSGHSPSHSSAASTSMYSSGEHGYGSVADGHIVYSKSERGRPGS